MTVDLVKHPRVRLKEVRFRLWDKDWDLLEECYGNKPPKHWARDSNVTAVICDVLMAYQRAEDDGAAYHDNFLKGSSNL